MKITHNIARSFALILVLSIGTAAIWPKNIGYSQPNIRPSGLLKPPAVAPVVIKIKETMKMDNQNKLLQHKQEDSEREARIVFLEKQLDIANKKIKDVQDRFDDTISAVTKRKKLADANMKSFRDRVARIELRKAKDTADSTADAKLSLLDPMLIITGRDTIPVVVTKPVYLMRRHKKVFFGLLPLGSPYNDTLKIKVNEQ